MKNFFKVTTITALGGMVLCAAVVSASANRLASTDNAFKGDELFSSSTNEYAAANAASDVSSTMNISEIVIDYVPNADDMTYVREVKRNYDEQKTKYGQMLPTDYTDIPQEMTYGIMTDIDGLMVSHMKYVSSNGKTEIYTDREGEKVATLYYIDTQNAEIVFENGSIASEEDLISGTAVLVEYDMINETYPGNMHCTRIVILQ